MLGGADNPNGELPSYITGADNCEDSPDNSRHFQSDTCRYSSWAESCMPEGERSVKTLKVRCLSMNWTTIFIQNGN